MSRFCNAVGWWGVINQNVGAHPRIFAFSWTGCVLSNAVVDQISYAVLLMWRQLTPLAEANIVTYFVAWHGVCFHNIGIFTVHHCEEFFWRVFCEYFVQAHMPAWVVAVITRSTGRVTHEICFLYPAPCSF